MRAGSWNIVQVATGRPQSIASVSLIARVAFSGTPHTGSDPGEALPEELRGIVPRWAVALRCAREVGTTDVLRLGVVNQSLRSAFARPSLSVEHRTQDPGEALPFDLIRSLRAKRRLSVATRDMQSQHKPAILTPNLKNRVGNGCHRKHLESRTERNRYPKRHMAAELLDHHRSTIEIHQMRF
jgi:hypothetical protein